MKCLQLWPRLAIFALALNIVDVSAAVMPQIQTAAGSAHNLMLKADGTVWAWGWNYIGQLGVGLDDKENRAIPTQVLGLTDMVAVETGRDNSLALKRDGTVWGWGSNVSGRIGLGNTPSTTVPQQIAGLSNIVAITAAEDFALALKSDGTVWAFGGNSAGELGLGDYDVRLTPVRIPSLNNVKSIHAGYAQSFVLKNDGTVWGFGGNISGSLGLGDINGTNVPLKLPLKHIVALATGEMTSFALTSSGHLMAWGWNAKGQLGNGTLDNQKTPVLLAGLSNVASIATGFWHTLAVTRDGSLWAWGGNSVGQLGLGDTVLPDCDGQPCQKTPIKVPGVSGALIPAAANSHSEFLKSDGSVWGFGNNYSGQMGQGNFTPPYTSPVQVAADTHIASEFSANPLTVGAMSRQVANLNKLETFSVSTAMHGMDFRPAAISFAGNLNLGYSSGSCNTKVVSSACTFNVIVKPQSQVGQVRGYLSIPTSDTFSKAVIVPVNATLSGAFLIGLSSNYGYGSQTTGTMIDRTWTFMNQGDADVTITDTTLVGASAYSKQADTCSAQTLGPNGKCNITVRFLPDAVGKLTATLTLNSNDPGTPSLPAALVGTGVAP